MNAPTPLPSTPRRLRAPAANPPSTPAQVGLAPSRPESPARRDQSGFLSESWGLGATVFRLASQLPVLGVLGGLSLVGRAADAWHDRRRRK